MLNQSFGRTRFVYHYYLSKIKEKGYTSAYDNIKDLKNNLVLEYPFLKEVDSTILRKEIFHLDDNLKRYYNCNDFGYPKFKSKHYKNSFTTSAVYSKYKNKKYCNIELDLKNKEIKLPKLKKIKIRGYRTLTNINGKIINASINIMYEGMKLYIKEKYSLV